MYTLRVSTTSVHACVHMGVLEGMCARCPCVCHNTRSIRTGCVCVCVLYVSVGISG